MNSPSNGTERDVSRQPFAFRVYPRCDVQDRFAVVGPNGCVLPLRPLWEEEALFVAEALNKYVEE